MNIDEFEPNTFYIDNREYSRYYAFNLFLNGRNSKEKPYLKNGNLRYDGHKRPFNIVRTNLEIGDYAYMNEKGETIGIEWKTMNDMIWSINTSEDSVFRKCIDLIEHYDSPHLIIVGDKNNCPTDEMSYEMTLNSLGHSLNIREPRTTEYGFYHIIKLLTNYDDGIGIPRKFYNRSYKESIPLIYHLTGLGWKMSANLCINNNIHTNDDALKVLSLSKDELKKLKGIGEVKAENMINFMNNNQPWKYT